MWVNDKKKLVFIHIPKNGGTSVVKSLDEDWKKISVTDCFPPNDHHAKQNQIHTDKYDDYHFFAISRNPWARMLSLYQFLVYQSGSLLDKEGPKGDWARMCHPILTSQGFNNSICEGGYFGNIYKNRKIDPRGWSEFDSSCSWMDNGEWFDIEEIHKLEKFGINPCFKNSTKHIHYKYYYSTEARNAVESYFQDDIEKFSYSY